MLEEVLIYSLAYAAIALGSSHTLRSINIIKNWIEDYTYNKKINALYPVNQNPTTEEVVV